MRFPVLFQRRHGGSGSVKTFSSDSAPTTSPPTTAQDNVLSCRFWTNQGFPVQRIAAAWTAPTATTALSASLYVWEETSGHWYLCNTTAVSMAKGALYYFDVPTIAEPAPTKANIANASAGSLDCFLLLTATDDDTYTIVLAPDVTTIGS